MIDLHCHILPGIDDGPAAIAGSLTLARAAEAAGIETVVATPHVSREYPNDACAIARLVERTGAQLAGAGIAVELRGGAEIAMTMVAKLASEELSRLALGGGEWLLVECPFTTLAAGFDTMILGLLGDGHRVVLAHPERSPLFHRDPQTLGSLARNGVLMSITAGSLAGHFGGRVQRFAARLAREELVHNVASDAHDDRRRPPGMRTEIEHSELRPLADWLTGAVPAAILAGEEIPPRPASAAAPTAASKWWRRQRG